MAEQAFGMIARQESLWNIKIEGDKEEVGVFVGFEVLFQGIKTKKV